MALKTEVLDRLLLAKSFLDRIRFQPVAVHDRHTLAANIISAHDAAELALAGICDQLDCLPHGRGNAYLMDYFEPLKESRHAKEEVYAKSFFRNLNDTRKLVKHQGLFPDSKQWSRVAELSFEHITKWCWDYLGVSFAELDESALITSPEAKGLYDQAKGLTEENDFKSALEHIALALSTVFTDNAALRGFEAGKPKTEDAIRLAGFGVHSNDFLVLQQFLPHIARWGENANVPQWRQSGNGHPGNWTRHTVDFCLRTFVDVAVKIQGAQWIPAPLERSVLYDQQIEAKKDGVEIWSYVKRDSRGVVLKGFEAITAGTTERERVRVLKRGQPIRATVSISTESSGNTAQDLLSGGGVKNPQILSVMGRDIDGFFYGYVLASDVAVTCVPKDADYVREYFQWLPTFEWEPE